MRDILDKIKNLPKEERVTITVFLSSIITSFILVPWFLVVRATGNNTDGEQHVEIATPFSAIGKMFSNDFGNIKKDFVGVLDDVKESNNKLKNESLGQSQFGTTTSTNTLPIIAATSSATTSNLSDMNVSKRK